MDIQWADKIRIWANDIINNITDEITPSKDDAVNFLNMDPNQIKVVILGQDPYPTPSVANGYAFAVNKNNKIPKSLNNIFKEIKHEFGIINTDETLQSWIDQGVLLLNTALTTKVGVPNAHTKLWHDFTIELIKWIDTHINPIWVLWGNNAIAHKKHINGTIITDAHPSPLSVRHRKKDTFKKLKKLVDINW